MLAGLLALVACGLPEIDLEGAHVRLAIDPGLTPCGDPTGHMDHFIRLTAAELRVTPPTGDRRISYYWLDRDHFEELSRCGAREVAGCAWGDDLIFARSFPIDHELVHSLAQTYGAVPPMFGEGLAGVYEVPAPGPDDEPWMTGATVAEVIEEFQGEYLPAEHYPLAAAFVGFLIERNGVDALLRAMAHMRYTDGPRRISNLLEAELGAPLEQLSREFQITQYRCPGRALHRKLFECSAPEIAWDGELWVGHRTLGCDQDDVIGPFYSETLASYSTIEVPVDGTYALTVIGDAEVGAGETRHAVTLLRCGGCTGHVQATIAAGSRTQTLTLTAGLYSLRFTGPVEAATSVGLRLERVEAP